MVSLWDTWELSVIPTDVEEPVVEIPGAAVVSGASLEVPDFPGVINLAILSPALVVSPYSSLVVPSDVTSLPGGKIPSASVVTSDSDPVDHERPEEGPVVSDSPVDNLLVTKPSRADTGDLENPGEEPVVSEPIPSGLVVLNRSADGPVKPDDTDEKVVVLANI